MLTPNARSSQAPHSSMGNQRRLLPSLMMTFIIGYGWLTGVCPSVATGTRIVDETPSEPRVDVTRFIVTESTTVDLRDVPPGELDSDNAIVPPPLLPIPANLPPGPGEIGASESESPSGSIASVGPNPSPLPVSSFQAAPSQTVTPPDTHGAIGPHHAMTILNSVVHFQDRDGFTYNTYPLFTFWNVGYPPVCCPFFSLSDVFDPRVVYDPTCNRWMAVAAANRASASSSILLAVSQTTDPTGAWSYYRIDADASDTVWADFPTIGVSNNWVVLQANMFDIGGAGAFNRSHVYALDKNALCTGGPFGATMFSLVGFGATHVPVTAYDTNTDHHLLNVWNGAAGQLRLYRITGPVGGEALNPIAFVNTPITWSQSSPGGANFAPQLGTANLIQTNDDRLQNAVRRNGTIWTAHTIFLPTGAPTRSAIHWLQLNTAGGVVQRGQIGGTMGADFFAFPSIAVNRNNDVLIGYTGFSAGTFASAGYTYRWSSDAFNLTRDSTILKAGLASYFLPDGNGRNRWGDYSHTVVDPVNDTEFWTIQEYAEVDTTFPPPPNLSRSGSWWGRFGSSCAPSMVWGRAATDGPNRNGGPALAYDSRRGYVVLFGGVNGTVEWSGSAWTWRNPSNQPSDRSVTGGLAYDGSRGVTVLFGGFDFGAGGPVNDTWEWNGTNWTQRSAGGISSPPARYAHGLAYDANRQVTVLFGGFDGVSSEFNDTWEWNGSVWTQRTPANSPSARSSFAMAYDTVRGVTVLHGGGNDETWTWNGTNWNQQFPTNSPGSRGGHAMAFDTTRGVAVLQGGNSWPDDDGTWHWNGTNWTRGADNTPSFQSFHAMAYDGARRQIVLLGDQCLGCFVTNATTWVYPTQSMTQAYRLTGGTSTGNGWSWSIDGFGTRLRNLVTPGVAVGSPLSAITTQFVSSVNAQACQGISAAVTPTAPTTFSVTMGGTMAFSLCTGPQGSLPTCCLPSPGCTFNPTITQIDLTGLDCDGNLTDDAIDLAAGTHSDENANSIPDICECASNLDCFDDNACTCNQCTTGSCQSEATWFGNVNCSVNQEPNLDDILCVIAGFGDPTVCLNGDIAPTTGPDACRGDGQINLDDILAVLAAFAGDDPCGCQD